MTNSRKRPLDGNWSAWTRWLKSGPWAACMTRSFLLLVRNLASIAQNRLRRLLLGNNLFVLDDNVPIDAERERCGYSELRASMLGRSSGQCTEQPVFAKTGRTKNRRYLS